MPHPLKLTSLLLLFTLTITANTPPLNKTYNSNGNLLTTTDALGHSETTTYNTLGSPVSISDKNGNTLSITYSSINTPKTLTTPLGATTTYAYDQFGNKISQTDEHNNTTTYTYDREWVPFLGAVATMAQELGYLLIAKYAAMQNEINFITGRI